MSQFRLLTVGRPRDRNLMSLVNEYLGRLPSSMGVRWEVVAEAPFHRTDQDRALRQEGERLLAKLSKGDYVILLDISGEQIDSIELAARLQGWRLSASPIVWVVGGSLGVSEQVRQRAQWRWSLSPLTLPHGLAQVVLAEQIYRAWTLVQGHPYHK